MASSWTPWTPHTTPRMTVEAAPSNIYAAIEPLRRSCPTSCPTTARYRPIRADTARHKTQTEWASAALAITGWTARTELHHLRRDVRDPAFGDCTGDQRSAHQVADQ